MYKVLTPCIKTPIQILMDLWRPRTYLCVGGWLRVKGDTRFGTDLIIFLREVPESGVMLKPIVSDILSQCLCLRPGLHRMCTIGRYSWTPEEIIIDEVPKKILAGVI